MFQLSGGRTHTSSLAHTLLVNSGLPLDESRDDSFAVTLYRRDPVDRHLYLTAMSGIREPEPMYGPLLTHSALERSRDAKSKPYAFAQREETRIHKRLPTTPNTQWLLYANCRRDTDAAAFDRIEARLTGALDLICSEQERSPLYPELWYAERLARDELRTALSVVPPGTTLEDVAVHVSKALSDSTERLGLGARTLGIYLDTGDDWRLCGPNAIHPWLPESVAGHSSTESPNAFDWVARASCPVLISKHLSSRWRARLENCCEDLRVVLQRPQFSGLCLAPIIYPENQWRTVGVLLLLSSNAELGPVSVSTIIEGEQEDFEQGS